MAESGPPADPARLFLLASEVEVPRIQSLLYAEFTAGQPEQGQLQSSYAAMTRPLVTT